VGLRSIVTTKVIDKLGTLNRNSEKLKIAHLNVQSLRNKLEEVDILLSDLNCHLISIN